jgi:hypothetical protein
MILVARARATVWKVKKSAAGVITKLEKKSEYVNHYSFHIMDPAWGHLVIKMSGHPPFGAQVILNGHEYVACAAQAEGIGFTKEGNCFTEITDPRGLAQIAETLSHDAAAGRLGRACDRWIYSACLCFGLDLAEQQASGFRYACSTCQAEYSRNLIFASGADGPGFRHRRRPDPVPAGRAGAAHLVRGEEAAGRHCRTLAETRSRDRETSV